ncbi:MAG: 16S rRNA (guanine(527)-N(7))-methyltransferase RsmG [Spirochaetia bacterium]
MNTSLLIEGMRRLSVNLPDSGLAKLEIYYQELELFSSRLNLVNAQEDALIIEHFLDCLAGVPELKRLNPETVLDAGSGAGFPGVVLAIAFPDMQFTLLERSGKRSTFLKNCTAAAGLHNVRVVQNDLSNLREQFDIVTLRAFRSFAEFFHQLTLHLNEEGRVFAYKGKKEMAKQEAEFAEKQGWKAELNPLDVPFLNKERHLLIIRQNN